MGTARPDTIRVLHENFESGLATWWKALFFTPVWLTVIVPLIGVTMRQIHQDYAGALAIVVFGLVYFLRDLLRKRLLILPHSLSFGFTELPFQKIKEISVRANLFKLPNYLVITADDGRDTIQLCVDRLNAGDLETLINILQKKAPQCKIDADVDAVLRYKKAKLDIVPDFGNNMKISYHPNRGWEELPQHFYALLRGWSRVIGPTGVLLLCAPLSIFFNFFLYECIRDYSSYSQYQSMYDFLAALVTAGLGVQQMLIANAGNFLWQIASQPATFVLSAIALLFIINDMLKAELSANRITIDAHELSLDRWRYLWSYTTAVVTWSSVTKVWQSRNGERALICFEQVGEREPVQINLDAIDSQDRIRLLQAIRKFAPPHCDIDPELMDLLESRNRKSYTQLWLQSLSGAPERKNLEPLKPGNLLDNCRYEVIRRLGVGGQGTAYLCYDMGQHDTNSAPRRVALKETIIPVFAEPAVRQQCMENFLAEASLLERISSDHVVRLLDYFVDDHRAYLVLEHIDGVSLRQLVNESGALPVEKVDDLVKQMCAILKLLHEKNIIHRDFTPDNLILAPQGTLTLIDFNVAQEQQDGSTDTIVGKQAYVPPEQFRGQSSTQSDIYALGATVFFLLTGNDPEPLSRSSLPGEIAAISPVLDELVQRCTELELEQRLRSVEEISACIGTTTELLQEHNHSDKRDDDLVIVICEPEHEIVYDRVNS